MWLGKTMQFLCSHLDRKSREFLRIPTVGSRALEKLFDWSGDARFTTAYFYPSLRDVSRGMAPASRRTAPQNISVSATKLRPLLRLARSTTPIGT